jgi:hypothetical protein
LGVGPARKAGLKSPPIAAVGALNTGKNPARKVYAPANSIAGGLGNVLETISAHWPALPLHIHHFFAARDYS